MAPVENPKKKLPLNADVVPLHDVSFSGGVGLTLTAATHVIHSD